jgi:hypothetical protein
MLPVTAPSGQIGDLLSLVRLVQDPKAQETLAAMQETAAKAEAAHAEAIRLNGEAAKTKAEAEKQMREARILEEQSNSEFNKAKEMAAQAATATKSAAAREATTVKLARDLEEQAKREHDQCAEALNTANRREQLANEVKAAADIARKEYEGKLATLRAAVK